MRRRATSVLAVMYALSFVVVCLGTCFAGDTAKEHDCCKGEEGFRVVARDCCSVVPGRSETPPAVAAPALVVVLASPAVVPFAAADQRLTAPPAAAASPPLVLRI